MKYGEVDIMVRSWVSVVMYSATPGIFLASEAVVPLHNPVNPVEVTMLRAVSMITPVLINGGL